VEEEMQTKSVLQRQEEEELQMQTEEEEEIQTQIVKGQSVKVSAGIETRINNKRGSGHPLSDNVREPMEQAFEVDFSAVKVHADTEAHNLNQQLNAKAFTTGQDIFFRYGEYNPNSDSGRKLIAHELTHVVQQSNGKIGINMLTKTKSKQQPLYGYKNDSVTLINREERTITKTGNRETIIQWGEGGKLETIKAVTRNVGEDINPTEAPGVSLENKKTKTWKKGEISEVSEHVGSIYIYIKSPDKDIWVLSEAGGYFALQPVSQTSKKRGKLKGRLKDFIAGTEGKTSTTVVADQIYDNMQKTLKYKVGGVNLWKGIMEGTNEAECTAIARAMLHAVKTALIVNGVSIDTIRTNKKDTPFLTDSEECDEAKSVIKGKWSNICTKNDGGTISVYNGKLQKFDNHEWLEVSGNVYDLVAGIKNGGASCVGEDLTAIEGGFSYTDGQIKEQSREESVVSKPKPPWPTGYTLISPPA
jgi:hypothetical protein